jgi:hypothetical protein
VATLGIASAASAGDAKNYHGSACQPQVEFLDQEETPYYISPFELFRLADGIMNASDVPVSLMCPVVKDVIGSRPTYAHVVVKGQPGSEFICSFEGTSNSADERTIVLRDRDYHVVSIPVPRRAHTNEGFAIHCQVPSGGILGAYRVTEG